MRLLRIIRPYWGPLARGLALSLVIGSVGMVTPFISQQLIDKAYPAQNITLMHVLVAAALAISITSAAMSTVRSLYSQVVGARLGSATRLMFLNHLQHLPMRFFDDHRVGEILSRFGDLGSSVGTVTSMCQTLLLRGTYLLLVPPVLFALNWRLALLSIVTIPLTTTIGTVTGRFLRKLSARGAEASANLGAYQVEVISNIHTVKALAAEHRVYARAKREVAEILRLQMKAGIVGTMVGLMNGIIRAGGTALFAWFSWTLILRGELTLGEFVAFTAYQGYLRGPLGRFASLFVGLQQSAVTFGRTFDYLDSPAEQDPALAYTTPAPVSRHLAGQLSLDHVSFGYQPETLVLKDVTFDIDPGSIVAVVGPSGAGKSSLFRLLSRMEEPTGGTIRADGTPFTSIPLPDVRRQVSVVLQEVTLLRGTLFENLTWGADVSREAVDEAVRLSCLEGVLADLPDGLQTIVAERGASLSGGQRQRIAIARALLCNTPILLLDEATSNLDVETEASVIRGLFSRLPRRTIIFATHRMATAEMADRIIVLQDGRVDAIGTHAELLASSESYRGMHVLRRAGQSARRTAVPVAGV